MANGHTCLGSEFEIQESRYGTDLEFCQNHNGDVDVLDKMLETATELEVPTVKLQCAFADDLSFRPLFEEGAPDGVVPVNKRPFAVEYDRLKRLELPFSVLETFVKRANVHGVTPCITAFNYKHISALVDCGFKTIKIASYDCASDVLLEKCAANFDRIIVSTGATFDYEIENTSRLLSKAGIDFSLLHCVTLYPTPVADANIAYVVSKGVLRSSWLFDHFGRGESADANLLTKVAIHEGADLVEQRFTILSG